MGTRYLIDTNIVIYFLGDLIPAPHNDFLSNLFDKDINISVISKRDVKNFGKISDIKIYNPFGQKN